MFAEAEDDRQQYTMVVHNVTARLAADTQAAGEGAVCIDGDTARTFRELVDIISTRVQDEDEADRWAGRAIGAGTINAFVRRLHGSIRHLDRLIRADQPDGAAHLVNDEAQVTVVDLHNLNDRAKRFVVGVVLRRAFDKKERQARPARCSSWCWTSSTSTRHARGPAPSRRSSWTWPNGAARSASS